MFCRKCGKEILDDSAFCSGCGVSVEDEPNDEQEELVNAVTLDVEESESNLYLNPVKCPVCGKYNTAIHSNCEDCGKQLTEDGRSPAEHWKDARRSSNSVKKGWIFIGIAAIVIISTVVYFKYSYDHTGDSAEKAAAIKISNVETTQKIITKDNAVEYLISGIKSGNYEDAWYKTYDLTTYSEKSYPPLSEIDTLNAYANALMDNDKNDYYSRNSDIELWISPNYKGRLCEEIKGFCLKYADVSKDYDGRTVYRVSEKKTKSELDARVPPRIGMTETEVYNSTWGAPDDKNKTETANGTDEQWVYNGDNYDNKYLYLTDGIVTAIQN